MRVDSFYQTKTEEKRIPLLTVNKEEWMQCRVENGDYPLLKMQQFEGAAGDVGLIYDAQGLLKRAYLGIGANQAVAAIAQAATRLPAGCYQASDLPQMALITWSLAQYRFDHYKKSMVDPRVLFLDNIIYQSVKTIAESVFLIRDLINMPANVLNPETLAESAADIARQHGADFQQWVDKELLQANFPAIYTVGKASAIAPRLISLTWGDEKAPKITLIGKGVCFDSGGLDIKPSSNMRLMKKDMGGAAHALGLAQWIMQNQLPVRLQVLIPAVENVIGPDAFKPGDIITMRNGLTVEIDNTDAEGRLVLADACALAVESEPELIIDFATLTGAARIAVGTDIAAMFCNDDKVANELLQAAMIENDPIWRLPLFDAYETMLDSSIADMVNSSSSTYAGAITAALFLRHFIKPSISWVHFDIMAWNLSGKPGKPEGGEAMGIRAIAHYLQKKYR